MDGKLRKIARNLFPSGLVLDIYDQEFRWIAGGETVLVAAPPGTRRRDLRSVIVIGRTCWMSNWSFVVKS